MSSRGHSEHKEPTRKPRTHKTPNDSSPGTLPTRKGKAKDVQRPPSPSKRSTAQRRSIPKAVTSKEAAPSGLDPSPHRSSMHFSPYTDGSCKDVAFVSPSPGSPKGKTSHKPTGRAFPELLTAPESLRPTSLSRKRSYGKSEEDSNLFRHFTKEIDRINESTKSRTEEDTDTHHVGRRRSKERKTSKISRDVRSTTEGGRSGLKPCSDTSPAGHNIGSWTKRGRLLLPCVATFGIFLVAAFIACIYVLVPKSTVQYGCTSSDCVRFNESLLKLLNTSVDPCEDFYSYVCSTWLTTSSQSYQDTVVNGFYSALNDSIMTQSNVGSDRYGMEALMHLYKSCYTFMSAKTPSLQDMVKISLSFLPYGQMTDSKDLPELWGTLVDIAVTKGVYTTFSVKYLYVGKRPTLHLIAETSIQGKIREVYVKVVGQTGSLPKFEAYVRDVLQVLYDDSDIEQKVELLAKWDAQVDAVLQSRETGRYIPFKSLSAFTSAGALQRYIDVVNRATPEHLHISMDKEIYVEGLEQIVNTSAVAAAHAVQWQCIYYGIHLVTDVVRYAYLRRDVPAAQKATDRTCVMVSEATLRHSWLYSVARLIGSSGTAKTVKDIGETTKDAIIRAMPSWMDPFTNAKVASYIKNITIFTYQESELWGAVANIDYNGFVHDESDDFVHFFWKLKAYEKTLVYQQIIPQQYVALSRHQVLARLAYDTRYRLLSVPTAFQRPPLYHTGTTLPFYVNFATLGTLIATGLIRSGALHLTWSSKTMNKFYAYVACLKNVQRSLGLKMQPRADEAAWNRSIFFLTYGSRVAHDQVKTTLQKDQGFQRDWDVAEPIFFIRYCMMFCASQPAPGEPLLPREQCLIPLHSNPSFHTRYNCASRKSAVQSQPCIASLFT